MIILEQDFYANFSGAVKSKNMESVDELMADQLGAVIANQTDSLYKLFAAAKIPAPPRNADAITKTIIDNVPKNKVLTKGLIHLIGVENKMVSNFGNAFGDKLKGLFGGGGGGEGGNSNWGQAASNIGNGLVSLVQGIRNKRGKGKNRAEQIAQNASSRNPVLPRARSNNTVYWVIGGVAAVGLTAAIIYYVRNKNK